MFNLFFPLPMKKGQRRKAVGPGSRGYFDPELGLHSSSPELSIKLLCVHGVWSAHVSGRVCVCVCVYT